MKDPREVYQQLMDDLRSAGLELGNEDAAWRQNGQLCCALYAIAAELRELKEMFTNAEATIDVCVMADSQPERTE